MCVFWTQVIPKLHDHLRPALKRAKFLLMRSDEAQDKSATLEQSGTLEIAARVLNDQGVCLNAARIKVAALHGRTDKA